MASLSIDDQFIDNNVDQTLEMRDDDDDDDDDQGISHPSPLQACQPPILFKEFDETPDHKVLNEISSISQTNATQLQRSGDIQSEAQQLHHGARYCHQLHGCENDWTHLVVWPMLLLARKVSGLEDEVRVVPLQTVQISPKNLLPQLPDGTVVDKKIDYGIVIELNNNQIDQIDQIDPIQGISPSTSVQLRTRPLFCFVEVKKSFQAYDPRTQLGVWTSATYTKWEQFSASQDSPPHQDLPISFGWTVTGHYWHLYLMRRLPDGTRQITADIRSYDTRSLCDIYLILAALCEVMSRGNSEFRIGFTTSVLNLSSINSTPNPVSTSNLALAPAPAQIRTSPRRQRNR